MSITNLLLNYLPIFVNVHILKFAQITSLEMCAILFSDPIPSLCYW